VVFSVNLSEQFFAKVDIPGFLEAIISAHHVEPGQLIFELSQSYIVRNIDGLQEILTVLARRGFRFAIDDFGADFGSFNYIKKFPVHFLKIDSSLIENITMDKIAKATVRSIVEVAAELNMQTIAKNVIDEAGVTLLRDLGVDYAQGNHIAAASPQLNNAVFKN
jgi:EAL domain-containing protein (putative c-di-GMP-specific phosphodiesterase class I)